MESLEQQIQQRLKFVEDQDRSEQIELQAKMVEIEKRHARFDQLAGELMANVIDPRMRKLASFFDNAELLESDGAGKHACVCRFDHSSRYPASVKLRLSVAHDTEIENVLLVYNLDILPIFFKFDGHDQAAYSLDDADQQQITEWVDERILAFVDTYIRLEQTDQYQKSSLVTDPVCGMRFRKSIASAETSHADHMYYFCSQGCHEIFKAEPSRYVPNEVRHR